MVGSVIASSDQAIANGLNQLSTGTLVTQEIKNTGSYNGYQIGVSGGYSWGGAQQTNSAGATQPTSGGASALPPTWAVAFGSDKSTTHSAISGADIVIRNADGQLALTGKTVAETIASLSHDTTGALNSLSPIFDKEKIQAGFGIVTTAQQQAATFFSYRQKDIADLLKTASDKNASPAEQQAALQQAIELQNEWGAGGKYRVILNAVLAGTAGNVSGGVGQMLQAGAVNYFQSLSASEVKKIADALGKDADVASGSTSSTNPSAEAARAALHAIVGCAGAAASSAACSAGALGAAAGSVINSLLGGDPKGMSPQEQEDRRNLVASMVEGIATIAGRNIAAATSSAITETENNYLMPTEIKEYVAAEDKLGNCKDSQCERDAKADIARLEKLSYDRDTAATEQCTGKTSCAKEIKDIAEDIAALETFAQTATGREAKIVAVQLAAARKTYNDLLSYVEQNAANDLGPGFQDVSDEQLISGGYLTASQVADLRKSEVTRKENYIASLTDLLIILATEGVGRGVTKARGEISSVKQAVTNASSESAILNDGPHVTWKDITVGSSVTNTEINLTRVEFEQGLLDAGFTARKLGGPKDVTLFTKGDKRYSVRNDANSTNGPSADYRVGDELIGKIRLMDK